MQGRSRRGVRGFGAACLLLIAACSGEQGSEPLGQSEEALTVCPAGATVKGIDVSVYQGDVDWPTAKTTGLDFAIARISDGTDLDTKFATNWPAMKSAGLVRGAYQFFEPADDPGAQAQIVVAAVGMLRDGDLPVTADMEVTGGQSEATIIAHLQTWTAAVEAGTGKAPMIYTALGYWNASVASTTFASTPLWVANWGATCPDLPTAWSDWKLWQYADDGAVVGISGNVDEDEFNGSLADLQAFAGAVNADDAGADAADLADAGDDSDAAPIDEDAGDASSTGFDTQAQSSGSGGCGVASPDRSSTSLFALALCAMAARMRRRRS
jgi:GH25 family lysozyme M1 (1,4-beta-N-acetylmuramidase)